MSPVKIRCCLSPLIHPSPREICLPCVASSRAWKNEPYRRFQRVRRSHRFCTRMVGLLIGPSTQTRQLHPESTTRLLGHCRKHALILVIKVVVTSCFNRKYKRQIYGNGHVAIKKYINRDARANVSPSSINQLAVDQTPSTFDSWPPKEVFECTRDNS
jgi:hypothetical protein